MPSKRKFFTLLITASFLLLACENSSQEEVDNTDQEAVETEEATLVNNNETEEAEETEEVDEMLVTNGLLLEVGQYTIDDLYGRIELVKIASPNNEIEIASNIFVTIGDVKILNFPEIPEEAQEDANYWYGFEGDQGYNLQFEYAVENRNDYRVDNIVIERLILSDGEQIERNFLGDETYDLEAGSRVSNQVGHAAIQNPDISSVRFYMNPWHGETYEDIESSPIEVSFPE